MKKIILLAFAFISLNVVCAQTSVWDGSNSPIVNGNGTESDPYLIENAQHLAYLAYLVNNGVDADANHIVCANLWYKMMVNIDLNGSQAFQWIPIGFYNDGMNYYSFGGHLDGNGKTVANLYINTEAQQRSGLFGMINGASIKDLSIVGNSSINSAITNGAVVAYSSGIVNIDNVSNAANVSSSFSDAAGIVGYNEGYLTINNCSNTGNITAISIDNNARAGGMIAYSSGTAMMNFCYNTGKIAAEIFAGGIIGLSYNSQPLMVNYCYNTGNISANCAGGIIGRTSTGAAQITSSYNMGKISSNYYSGGIAGDRSAGTLKISNCYNTGTAAQAIIYTGTSSVINTYYLNTCSSNNSNGGIPKTEEFMKSPDMVTLLGYPFIQDNEPYCNDGFPIMSGVDYPASVKTTEATNVSQTKATLHGAFSAGTTTLIDKGFEYRLATASTFTTITLSGANTSFTLTDLVPGKQYQFRAFITIPESGKKYGATQAFTTLNITATTQEPTDITCFSATLHGTTNFGDATVLKQGFLLTKPTGDEKIEVSNTSTTLTHNLTDLPRATLFFYKTFCTTAAGTVYGELKQFTTLAFKQNGTSNLIENIDDLQLLSQLVGDGSAFNGQKFILVNDLTLPTSPNAVNPIGKYPNRPFGGEFDGNAKKIINMKIDNPTNSYQGVFSYTKNANIYKLGVENITATGKDYTGGIVGYAENTKINDCFVSGGAISASNYCGGLVGYQTQGANAVITSCYSTATVTGNENVGGLLGYSLQGTVKNSYAAGLVTGQSSATGALIGGAVNVTKSDCYFNEEITGQHIAIGETTPSGNEGNLTSAQMRKKDFVNKLNQGLSTPAWTTDNTPNINSGFAILLWQSNIVGIVETSPATSIQVYPNPTTGELRITNYELGINNEQLTINNVEIYDIYGKQQSSHHLIISSSHHLINISELPAGVYFVKISTEAGEVVKKVVKQYK